MDLNQGSNVPRTCPVEEVKGSGLKKRNATNLLRTLQRSSKCYRSTVGMTHQMNWGRDTINGPQEGDCFVNQRKVSLAGGNNGSRHES